MVIDTSAILAMLFDEPEAGAFARVEADPVVLVSVVSRVEATFVIEGRTGDAGRGRLDRFLGLTGAEVGVTARKCVPCTPDETGT